MYVCVCFLVGAGGFDSTQVGGSGVQSETKAEVFSLIFFLNACKNVNESIQIAKM